MYIESIIDVINEALARINNQVDYIRLLIFFFERVIVEKKYGDLGGIDSFVACRKEIHDLFMNHLQTSLFDNAFDYERIKEVYDLFNQCSKGIDLSELGYIFEELYNKEIDSDTGKLMISTSRKENGMFFSDRKLVRFIVNNILSDDCNFMEKTYIDSSMGAGIFLTEIIAQVSSKEGVDIKCFIENNIYGVDKNPMVVDIFKLCLWIQFPAIDLCKIDEHILSFDSLLVPIYGNEKSWENIFPEVIREKKGFDYVVGNPPWGRIKANIREYNLYYNTLARIFQGKRMKDAISHDSVGTEWEKYREDIAAYSKRLKDRKDFKYQNYIVNTGTTGGDADLYKYFLELSYNILGRGGKLGFIIPASFYMNEGATGLRHLFLENGIIEVLYCFENRGHIFPIHSSYKFSVMIYRKQGCKGKIEKAAFNLTDSSSLFGKMITLDYSIEDLCVCSGGYWTIPECRSKEEMKLYLKLYRAYNKYPSWKVSFNRELDITLDSDIFVLDNEKKPDENYLPLYEGRMVSQYNCYSKKYIKGNGRTAVWEKNLNPEKGEIRPHYYVKRNDVEKRGISLKYRAAYCDITGQKNVRTVLAALIPDNTVCGNKVPTCVFFPDNDIKFHLLWIGIANSFITDWLLRKKIAITLNFFHWNQIPFAWMETDSKEAVLICAAVARILKNKNGIDIESLLDDKVKKKYDDFEQLGNDDLRALIDITVADYYGLNLYEMAMILFDFQGLDQKMKGIPGDMRYGTNRKASFVTRDKVLSQFINSHSLQEDDIVDIYAKAGICITKYTSSEFYSIYERMKFYEENKIVAYTD
ncbi:MAG: N-6 DNA methylase [Blautia sp.]|nr:N-6 DNA methylase [Blautia sp.]MCM1201856.1 N-6 DNA methylase [Bacteroides fragilis]